MQFLEALNESYSIARIKYKGSRKNYKIHDPEPLVLVLDNHYNVDGKGDSILGINLNYVGDDAKEIVKEINKVDNNAGFRFFDTKYKIKKYFSKDKKEIEEKEIEERKRRYKNFIDNFPYMGKFIRRYKYNAITDRKNKLWI